MAGDPEARFELTAVGPPVVWESNHAGGPAPLPEPRADLLRSRIIRVSEELAKGLDAVQA